MTKPEAPDAPRRRCAPALLLLPLRGAMLCALAVLFLSLPTPRAGADDALDDVFGGLGTAAVVDGESDELPSNLAANEGVVAGLVVGAENGMPVSGATVILTWPETVDGAEPRQEVQVTGSAGEYEFPRVPEGVYGMTFIKSGYRMSEMTKLEVIAGELNTADFPLPPQAVGNSEGVLDLDAFVVEASMVEDLMSSVEMRMDSDTLLNVMSAEDFSKYAASDVADALKRVAGVNVVAGRFAVIRGLEDRYSSTLFNGAPVPSSDPNRQSVQLDLFPSDVVSSLEIAKTFAAGSPSNSSGGAIDILTMGYPDDLTIKIGGGAGFNENSINEFWDYETNSPIGNPIDGTDVIDRDVSVSIGGREELWEREIRFKAVYSHEVDFDTALGVTEGLEPRISEVKVNRRTGDVAVESTGDLAKGDLTVSDGRFDWTLSRRTEQDTVFAAIGSDFDEAANHSIDATLFYTKKQLEAVQRLDDGYIPDFDYGSVQNFQWESTTLYGFQETAFATIGSLLNDYRIEFEKPQNGPAAFLPMFQGQSIKQERELLLFQLNGQHDFDFLEGLRFDWAANYAQTKQSEAAFRARYWYEPNSLRNYVSGPLPIPPSFPAQVEDFDEDGSYRTTSRDLIYIENEIDEQQFFGRGDFRYEFEPYRNILGDAGAGIWYENIERDVEFQQVEVRNPVPGQPGVVDNLFVEGLTERELGRNLYDGYALDDLGLPALSDFEREILAGYFDLKLTFWEDVDLLGGVRLEQIKIASDNRPFSGACAKAIGFSGGIENDPSKTGDCPDSYLPRIFPGRYLYLDRLDNPDNPFFREDPDFVTTGVFNDQILGIDLPTDENGFVDLVSNEEILDATSGKIDEFEALPMASIAYRPVEGMSLRGAYSQTVARPSFRELCYCATIVPGVSDRIVGNPYLELSHVDSYDVRTEYFWGNFGDLLAVSLFYKEIENPIELVVLRDFSVRDFPYQEGPFRVFRNNENTADLRGVEFETRLNWNLINDFWHLFQPTKDIGWLEYFSMGGNYTYIDAEVERSQFEIDVAAPYFPATDEDIAAGEVQFTKLGKKRRLFNQPEWIANADIAFDHPGWGTKIALSAFAISDVLLAAGAADLAVNGEPEGYVLDEFFDSYYQLDFVFSQGFSIPKTPGRWTFRTTAKNLTDSPRGIIYDTEATSKKYTKRKFRVGRDYSFSLQYQITF